MVKMKEAAVKRKRQSEGKTDSSKRSKTRGSSTPARNSRASRRSSRRDPTPEPEVQANGEYEDTEIEQEELDPSIIAGEDEVKEDEDIFEEKVSAKAKDVKVARPSNVQALVTIFVLFFTCGVPLARLQYVTQLDGVRQLKSGYESLNATKDSKEAYMKTPLGKSSKGECLQLLDHAFFKPKQLGYSEYCAELCTKASEIKSKIEEIQEEARKYNPAGLLCASIFEMIRGKKGTPSCSEAMKMVDETDCVADLASSFLALAGLFIGINAIFAPEDSSEKKRVTSGLDFCSVSILIYVLYSTGSFEMAAFKTAKAMLPVTIVAVVLFTQSTGLDPVMIEAAVAASAALFAGYFIVM